MSDWFDKFTEPAIAAILGTAVICLGLLMAGLVGLVGLLFTTGSETAPRPVVARICPDGTHVYKYPDGTYWTAFYRVEDPDKVCVPGIVTKSVP